MVDLRRIQTFPYIRRFWSTEAFKGMYQSYDKWMTDWEVDDETGEVVIGQTDGERKRIRKKAALVQEEIRREKAERLRAYQAAGFA